MKKVRVVIIVFIISSVMMFIISIFFYKDDVSSNFQDYLIFFKLFNNGQLEQKKENVKNAQDLSSQKDEFVPLDYYFMVDYEKINFRNINLLDTVNSKTLIKKKIAPGTSGSFNIILNSNQRTRYQIKVKSESEKPLNLKFYINGGKKEYSTLEELQDELVGILEKNIKKVIEIKWEWKYESTIAGNSEELRLQDLQDTIDGMKIQKYKFNIYVVGKVEGGENV